MYFSYSVKPQYNINQFMDSQLNLFIVLFVRSIHLTSNSVNFNVHSAILVQTFYDQTNTAL